MAGMSDFLEAELCDHTLRGETWAAPATVYVALYSVLETDAAGGTELSGNGYARQSCAFDACHATGGNTANTSAVTFSASGGAWSEAVGFAVWDSASSGNMLMHAALTANRTAGDGDDLVFAAGALTITFA